MPKKHKPTQQRRSNQPFKAPKPQRTDVPAAVRRPLRQPGR